MALVKLKPTSPGRRHAVKVVTPGLHKGKPFAALLEKKKESRFRPQQQRSHYVPSQGWWLQASLSRYRLPA